MKIPADTQKLQLGFWGFLIKNLEGKKEKSLLCLFREYPSVKQIDFRANSSHVLKCLKD